MEAPTEIQIAAPEFVRLKCVKEGNKLRIKIISPGYSSEANCQFPKNIRVDGREYTVPKSDVVLADTRGKFFYRIKKNNITVHDGPAPVDPSLDLSKLKVYGDENLVECNVCMNDVLAQPDIVFVIFSPCGHFCCCSGCAKQLKICPMCRAKIGQLVTKDQLQ
jgi:hypothetical protein